MATEIPGQLSLGFDGRKAGPAVTGPCHAFDERGVLCLAPATLLEETSGLGVCALHAFPRNLWVPRKRKMK